MIGTVRVADHDKVASASLHEDHTWTFEGDFYLKVALDSAAKAIDLDDYSPADGPFGPKFLHELADRVGGTVTLEPKAPAPSGRVY